MSKQIKAEQEGVRIIVDFQTVWAFAWRYYAIVFGIAFAIGFLVAIFS